MKQREGEQEQKSRFFGHVGLMPSGPVAESELRFDCKLSTLSGEKDTESRDSWV